MAIRRRIWLSGGEQRHHPAGDLSRPSRPALARTSCPRTPNASPPDLRSSLVAFGSRTFGFGSHSESLQSVENRFAYSPESWLRRYFFQPCRVACVGIRTDGCSPFLLIGVARAPSRAVSSPSSRGTTPTAPSRPTVATPTTRFSKTAPRARGGRGDVRLGERLSSKRQCGHMIQVGGDRNCSPSLTLPVVGAIRPEVGQRTS
jgi:hypothetical protein